MGKVHLFSFLLLPAVFSHEIYPGKCPDFTPMKQFDWTKVIIINFDNIFRGRSKEFEPRFKFKSRLKYDWFHLNLY